MLEKATKDNAPLTLDPLLSMRDLTPVVNLQPSAIYARISRGEFPAGILLSRRCRRWRRSDIAAWMESL